MALNPSSAKLYRAATAPPSSSLPKNPPVNEQVTPSALQASLDQSLKHLGTDYIDLYNLHGVVPQDYAYLVNDIYPALQKAQQQGKIRFVGLSEMFNEDFEHTMIQQALADDLWDVLMVGFNLLNQTARANVFAQAIAQNVGIQIMFAVRKALNHPDNLRAFTAALVEKGQIDPADLRLSSGVRRAQPSRRSLDAFPDFLLAEAPSLPDAAYRFCRDEPGVHVVLSGTGNAAHLDANLASFTRPPLTQKTRDRLIHIFRRVNSTTGQAV